MVTLPDVDSLSPAASGRSGRAIAPGVTDSVGPAIEGLGGAIGNLSDSMARTRNAAAAVSKANAVAGYQIDAMKVDDSLNIDTDPNYETYQPRGAAALQASQNKWGATIADPKQRAAFLTDTSVDMAGRVLKFGDRSVAQGHAKNLEDANTTLDTLAHNAISSNDPNAVTTSITAAHDLIDSLDANGTLSPGDAVKARREQAQRIVKLRYEADAVADPAGTLKKLGGDGSVPPLDTQYAFINNELNGTEKGAGQNLSAAGTVEDATKAFIGYERPRGWTAANPTGGDNYAGRLAAAQRVYSGRASPVEADAMQSFMAQGWTKEQAAGIVGNLVGESGMRPGASGDPTVVGGSHYVAQWNGDRLRAFKEFAANYSGSPGTAVSAPTDPHVAMLSPEDVIGLRAKAQSELNAQDQAARATAAATVADAKGTYSLGIQTGTLTDPNDFLGDPNLGNAAKAELMSSYNSANAERRKTTNALARASGDGASFSPFNDDDRKDADRVYTAMGGSAGLVDGDAQAKGRFGYVIEQTGVPPPSGLTTLLGAITGPDTGKAMNAYNVVSDLYAKNPRIFDGSPNADAFRAAAETYTHLTQDRGMSGQAAAQQMQAAYDPENKRTLEVLKPAADDFVKKLDPNKIAGKVGNFWFSTPAEGGMPQQADAFAADVAEIGREQFIKAHGDPVIAEQATIAAVKGLYSVTNSSGAPVLMRQAPELRYPPINGSYNYLNKEALAFAASTTGLDKAKPSASEASWPIGAPLPFKNGLAGISLVATRQTAADFASGTPTPRYDMVVWQWHNGQKILGDYLSGFRIPPERLAALQKPAVDHATQLHGRLTDKLATRAAATDPANDAFYPPDPAIAPVIDEYRQTLAGRGYSGQQLEDAVQTYRGDLETGLRGGR